MKMCVDAACASAVVRCMHAADRMASYKLARVQGKSGRAHERTSGSLHAVALEAMIMHRVHSAPS